MAIPSDVPPTVADLTPSNLVIPSDMLRCPICKLVWNGTSMTHALNCPIRTIQEQEIREAEQAAREKALRDAAGAVCDKCRAGHKPQPEILIDGDGHTFDCLMHADDEDPCPASNILRLLEEKNG